MDIRRRVSMMVTVLTLLGALGVPGQSWGQTGERIGTVLAVEGTAEVRAANTTAWEPLQFRAVLFHEDTVRTAAGSKVKVLLRDDSIVTLAESSEMQFTEFLLTPQQKRTVISLTLGRMKMLTGALFGTSSATEVRTANTVAGVRGTTFVVIFIPPEETNVISLDGVVAVQNPQFPQIEPIPANFQTQVIGFRPPTSATEVPESIRRTLELGLRLTEQIPVEVKPSIQRQASRPIRGEPTVAGAAAPLTAPAPAVAALPAGARPVPQDTMAQLDQLLAQTQTVSKAGAPEPTSAGSTGGLIQPGGTSSNQPPAPPSNLRITISFPR